MTAKMIRVAAFPILCALGACSTIEATVGAVEQPRAKGPAIDLSNADWQKLTPDQPPSNPLRVAIVERNEKIGATRVVLKVPAAFTMPPYWLTTSGNYTVLKGTFVFDAMTADGKRTANVQPPGSFAEIPQNYILKGVTRPGTEALLLITIYGEWAPKVADGAWTHQTARAN